MKTNVNDDQLASLPENFHPAMLDKLARMVEQGVEDPMALTDGEIRRQAEARAWRAVAMVADQHPEEWDTILQFLIDQARYFCDEIAQKVHEIDDPQKAFAVVKGNSGAAFGLFLAARTLNPAVLRRKAMAGRRGGTSHTL